MTAPALAIPAYPDGDHATHALFDTLSATRRDDGTVVVRGHLNDNPVTFTVAELDDHEARMIATLLTNLIDRGIKLAAAA
jgi:helix-turn-helix protein